jgi:hypothetical protein
MAKGAEHITGTVKIGRWVYPTETRGGWTYRNAKTNGTGEWLKMEAA